MRNWLAGILIGVVLMCGVDRFFVLKSFAGVQVEPDLIVIQSEAYMDVSKIKGLYVSENVNAVFKKYAALGESGELYVPVNGGMTCNSEFEFLTGMRAPLLGYNVYTDVLAKKKTKVNSLAWELQGIRYKTIGIHPYFKEYFNRNVVYPLLGFDKFVSLEQFVKPEQVGYWVSDAECFAKIQTVMDSVKGPKFVFNVTVQNHAPFCFKAPEDIVSVRADQPLTKEDRVSLTNYVSGLKITDNSLASFMAWVESRPQRTIVVFYGDHQPTKKHKIFSELTYFKGPLGFYKTQYMIYDNKAALEIKERPLTLVGLSRQVKSLMGLSLNTFDQYVINTQNDVLAYGSTKNSKIYLSHYEHQKDDMYHQQVARIQNKVK